MTLLFRHLGALNITKPLAPPGGTNEYVMYVT